MRRNSLCRFGWLVIVFILSATGAVTAFAKDKRTPQAEIEVKGLGWWDDRQQRNTLQRLLGNERGETLDANAIEDAVFLLLSALSETGYSKPIVDAELTAADGRKTTVRFDAKLEATVPRPFAARRLVLRVRKGVRYIFDHITVHGLRALPKEAGVEYFLGEKVLVRRGAARAYAPGHLQRALDSLQNELRRRGYADASVTASKVRIDDKTGSVDVDVEVNEGPRWEVTSLRLEGVPKTDELASLNLFVGQPWSRFWQQDVISAIREHFYQKGHPDLTVRLDRDIGEERNGVRPVTVVAHVNPGPEVRVGQVRFEGAGKTSETVLRRRVHNEPGEPLNVVAMNQARFRLARLGVFDAVDLRYEPATGPTRDAVFVLREGRERESNLLFGYGSYEQLRGGVELRQFNLFGRAHQSRLLLVQSMKSSRGEYSYTVPELFGESIDGTARVFGLKRQETSFLREEFGGNVSLSTRVPWLGANATLGYTYQSLRNLNNTLNTRTADEQQVTTGSVDLTLVRDRRDNPLRPRHGYRWFMQAETASRYFGGSVDFQRIEFGGSYHAAWGRGRWIHLGLNHGVITTFGGSNDSELPVNKRFFPGGDNSIRGYRVGEAAPLGPEGQYVGAKTYLLANAEVEQALTTKWSIVAFVDGLGTAVRLADYPFSERLYSVGLGVRYQTLIGPLRMEYGRNLNPRPIDPSGTLLFSVGFPF